MYEEGEEADGHYRCDEKRVERKEDVDASRCAYERPVGLMFKIIDVIRTILNILLQGVIILEPSVIVAARVSV